MGRFRDFGLLLMRVGLGVMMFFHGLPKIQGGPEKWKALGGAMAHLGIQFFPHVWGFLAAFAETGGAVLLVIGFFFRPAALMLAITMAVAVTMHVKTGDGFGDWSHAAELLIVFVGLFFVGPGRYSIDRN